MNRPTEGPGRVLAPQCRYWLPRHWTGARDCRAGCGVVEIPPRALTEDSVLARNGPGFVRRVVALRLPRIIPASQPLPHQSLAREHDEHLVVQRLGPAHVEHGPGRGCKSPAPSKSPATRTHITRSGRAAEASADRATDTVISVVSSHTGSSDSAANRTFAASGTTTAGVPPATDAPAGVRAGGADIEVRHHASTADCDRRAARTVALNPVLNRHCLLLRQCLSGHRGDELHAAIRVSRCDDGPGQLQPGDREPGRLAGRTPSRHSPGRWTWGRSVPRRVGCART